LDREALMALNLYSLDQLAKQIGQISDQPI
jgi:hypothetical protein